MRLIDEIEAAAKRAEIEPGPGWRSPGMDALIRDVQAQSVVLSFYWPRIKAALLAGEEMACVLEDDPDEHGQGSEHYAPECSACQALVDFRAATEGTKQGESDGRC